MGSYRYRASAVLLIFLATAGCSRRDVRASLPADISPADNSYIDLEAGKSLLIVVPILKSGGFRLADLGSAPRDSSGTISVFSSDFVGYTVSHYAIAAKKNGLVRLEFAFADTTRDGRTVKELNPPSLPFELPRRPAHIRLIHLVRISKADHNMAIMASNRLDILNLSTRRFEDDPNVCTDRDRLICSFVPAGVAVRLEEQQKVSKGS